uniref:Uncharacterized protein n=1 Tax=Romanomermis culicivorax TaxID=13658 RepID=A0A915K523_ROMCU
MSFHLKAESRWEPQVEVETNMGRFLGESYPSWTLNILLKMNVSFLNQMIGSLMIKNMARSNCQRGKVVKNSQSRHTLLGIVKIYKKCYCRAAPHQVSTKPIHIFLEEQNPTSHHAVPAPPKRKHATLCVKKKQTTIIYTKLFKCPSRNINFDLVEKN